MHVLIGGYVPEEGRVSIMRTAHSIARHAAPLLDTDDTIALCDPRAADHVQTSRNPRRVKLEKRLLGPARLWLRRADVYHLIDNDHAYGIAPWNFHRTLVTCHDLMPYLLDPTLESVFASPLGRHFYRQTLKNMAKCAHVACVSEFTRQTLLARSACQPERTSVIPQAVEAHFQPMTQDDPALEAFKRRHDLLDNRIILHVGSCMAYKNIAGLLNILRNLVKGGREDLVLLKVGGNFSDVDQDFMATHGLRSRVRHLSSVSEVELVQAYNVADLLLWTSRFEGFGLPVLEAMACGTPVVCTNGGALAEVAADKARVHAPDDLEGMADACREILDDPRLVRALRDGGIAHAANYTWPIAARAYGALYRRIATGAS